MHFPRGLLIYFWSVLSHLPVYHALECRGEEPVDISLVDTFSQTFGMLFKSNRFACNKFVLTLKLIATTSNARVGATQKYSLGECCQALNSYTSLTLHNHPSYNMSNTDGNYHFIHFKEFIHLIHNERPFVVWDAKHLSLFHSTCNQSNPTV